MQSKDSTRIVNDKVREHREEDAKRIPIQDDLLHRRLKPENGRVTLCRLNDVPEILHNHRRDHLRDTNKRNEPW